MERTLSREVCFDSAPPDHKTAHILRSQVRASSRTKGMERGWKRRVRLGIDVFSSRLTLFSRGGSDVRVLKKRFEGKPTVLQSITPLTFSISVCFRDLCFSPSRMAMGCCTMWQVALRVRSQLTTYKERCLAKLFTLKCWLSLTGYGDLKGLHSSLSFSTSRGIMSLIVH